MTGARRAFRPDYIPTRPATSLQHPIQHDQRRKEHEKQNDSPAYPAAGLPVAKLAAFIDVNVSPGLPTAENTGEIKDCDDWYKECCKQEM